ncbi:MAG: FixH family protein [Halioglobus sp.]
MTRQLPGGDTLPWYRQFWPWFLILLPASVVVAGLSTVYIASESADDLVVDEYYKDGLAINRQLEKKQRASALGISASLHFAGDTVTVLTSGPLQASQLQLLLSHPLEADRDFSVTLGLSSPQTYSARLPNKVAPHWYWVLEAPGDRSWRLDGTVQDTDFAHVTGK